MTDIEFRNITLDLPDGTRVLDDVHLAVPSGTNLAICGPARAGKTTLLRILAGLADATDGDILLDGVVSNRVSPRDRNLSMVFSDYLLHPHLDTYDNMAFAAQLRRMQPQDENDTLDEDDAHHIPNNKKLDQPQAKGGLHESVRGVRQRFVRRMANEGVSRAGSEARSSARTSAAPASCGSAGNRAN